jgi:hypothetical protein
MTVFTCTFVDQFFEKRSSEVGYIAKLLEIAAAELQRNQGDKTSGSIIGTNAAGVPNTSLGSWSYTPSGTLP